MLSEAVSRGTIERWSLERRSRPQAEGLEWLGYIKPDVREIQCPWCDRVQPHQGVVRVDDLVLYMCSICGSHRYWPRPDVPSIHEMTPFAIRNYVEYGAGLQPFCEYVAALTAGRPAGTLLDVGCGFGFAVDIARRQVGWRAIGVDPASIARSGAHTLAIDVRAIEIGRDDALGDSRFEAVLCAEVLAHSPDPAALLREMGQHLAPDGSILIATVTPNALYESDNVGIIQGVLGPRQHTFIPTGVGLARLVERLGLHVLHLEDTGISLRATVGMHKTRINLATTEDAARVAERYYSSILSEGVADPSVWIGVASRAFHHAVSYGDWKRAIVLARQMNRWLQAAEIAAVECSVKTNVVELFEDAPVCSSVLLFDAAMLALNSDADAGNAQRLFDLAARLSLRAFELAPELMAAEYDRYFSARIHQALALSKGTDKMPHGSSEAVRIMQSIANGAEPVPVTDAWRVRATTSLTKMGRGL
jgi:2-polyprenyl-3-methyl-5-hydroxy-6-metoxy-1,4-benzoquinol methylase